MNSTEAFIITNSVTISEERLRNQYRYEIRLLENEKKYKENNLKELNALIDSYPTDNILYISSGDSLVKIDSNSKQTYEQLINEKREISNELIDIDTELERYDMYLKALNTTAANTTAANTTAANTTSIITGISEKVNAVSQTFSELLQAYNETIVNESSVLLATPRYNGARLLSGGFIVAIIKATGPLAIIVLCICCIHAALYAIKAHKKQRVQD